MLKRTGRLAQAGWNFMTKCRNTFILEGGEECMNDHEKWAAHRPPNIFSIANALWNVNTFLFIITIFSKLSHCFSVVLYIFPGCVLILSVLLYVYKDRYKKIRNLFPIIIGTGHIDFRLRNCIYFVREEAMYLYIAHKHRPV